MDTAAIAEGIDWADSVLAAWEARGRKIPDYRYYLARANVMRIEERMDRQPYRVIKPIVQRWERFKARLEGHRP